MAKKREIRTDTKQVRQQVERSGGRPSHIDKPSRATGRRAQRVAAKQQDKVSVLKRADSKASKTVRKADQGTNGRQKQKKIRRAA